MEISFVLQLPRDAFTVPVMRRVLDGSMRTLGVVDECREDIEVAVTEACTNVLDHATVGDEYEVTVDLDNAGCVIEVVDTGGGFDADQHGHAEVDPSAETGRGIQLIRALVDRVQFRPQGGSGMTVRMEKELEFVDGSPLQRLADRGEDTAAFDLRRAREALHDGDTAPGTP